MSLKLDGKKLSLEIEERLNEYILNNKLKNTYWKKIIKSYRKPIICIYWKSNNIYKNTNSINHAIKIP